MTTNEQPRRAMTMREIREGLGHTVPPVDVPEPTALPTRYAVSCFEPDDENGALYNLAVEYRGRGLWAVVRHRQCLNARSEWSWESVPSEREDEWLAEHRFDLDTALRLAKQAAPHIVVNGYTAVDAYRRTHPAS
jgi:hypothetical protein